MTIVGFLRILGSSSSDFTRHNISIYALILHQTIEIKSLD